MAALFMLTCVIQSILLIDIGYRLLVLSGFLKYLFVGCSDFVHVSCLILCHSILKLFWLFEHRGLFCIHAILL